jgi:EmrB/QacA subfamily drug resistance transporter
MQSRILVPLIVATALFMEQLDTAVLSTALPVIARDLGEDPIHLKLAVTSYLLSLAVFLPISGWVADRFGGRLVFRIAMGVFMAGSILCGLSESMNGLIAARIVQGMGGAMMTPVGRLLILRSVRKQELVAALMWLSIPAILGPIMGPPIGGAIVTFLSWRWIFWLNVPIGIIGIIVATIFIPDVRGQPGAAFDTKGFLLVGLGLATFVTGTTTIGLQIFPFHVAAALLAGGLLLLGAYVVYALRSDAPVLDLRLLAIPTFRLALVGGSILRVAVGATPFLLPLMFQVAFGMSALDSGLLIFVSAIGVMASRFVSARLLKRFGFRLVLLVGTVTAAIFLGAPALFEATTPLFIILALLFASGLFRSLALSCVHALSFADIESPRMSQATSMSAVAQQLSLSAGVTIGAIMLELSLGGRGGANLVQSDFLPAFAGLTVIALLAAVPFLRLDRKAGAEVSGH